ncbi:hypothetical protein PIB30_058226 [Stylosanthes scabra]|uniref:Uncharacterized protein n=1 Tax=Stylosanthes scabra TaxID=79078 RepID=A0ABU6TM32_9FABA|nr:hypothetical protein [Stylosanthes scabra]
MNFMVRMDVATIAPILFKVVGVCFQVAFREAECVKASPEQYVRLAPLINKYSSYFGVDSGGGDDQWLIHAVGGLSNFLRGENDYWGWASG